MYAINTYSSRIVQMGLVLVHSQFCPADFGKAPQPRPPVAALHPRPRSSSFGTGRITGNASGFEMLVATIQYSILLA